MEIEVRNGHLIEIHFPHINESSLIPQNITFAAKLSILFSGKMNKLTINAHNVHYVYSVHSGIICYNKGEKE